MTDREQDREAFEKWASDVMLLNVGRCERRTYIDVDTYLAWKAWQAATAAASERIAELESITPLGYEEAKKFYDEWPGGLDEIQASVEGWNRIHKEQEARIAQLERERDEARADAERLRALINTPQTDDWLTAMRPGIDEAAIRARKEGS